jgi:cyclopropane fatty-acyl-phospholipid synthase-like methyltransferase
MHLEHGRSGRPLTGDRRVADTLAYYEREAADYAERARGLNCSSTYAPFVCRLTPGARILDAGCGSGRDAAAFQDMGFRVAAMDASPSLAQEAERLLGHSVVVCRHQDVVFANAFDGIWAMATLLHVPHDDLPDVLTRYRRALTPGGLLFCSFKFGEQDGPDAEGRWFTNMTRERMQSLVDTVGGWRIEQLRETPDSMRPDTRWLEVMLVKEMQGEPSSEGTMTRDG